MGDMADYALEQVAEMENLRYRFHNDDMDMHEAVECGFLEGNSMSESAGDPDRYCEGVMTLDTTDRQIGVLSMQLDSPSITASERFSNNNTQHKKPASPSCSVATAPSCVDCGSLMSDREGRFGKFFFCANLNCGSTRTVSEAQWKRETESVTSKVYIPPVIIPIDNLPHGIDYGVKALLDDTQIVVYLIHSHIMVLLTDGQVVGAYMNVDDVIAHIIHDSIDLQTLKEFECLLREALN